METVSDFIKNFKLGSYGLDIWDMWIILGCFILTFITLNWLASFQPSRASKKMKTILNVVFITLFYIVVTLMILNSALTRDYARLLVLIFLLVLPYLKRGVKGFYQRYDQVVDKFNDK